MTQSTSTMKIEALHTYPIKSLRAHALSSAELTEHGFKYDRRFMLLKPQESADSPGKVTYKNMHIAHDPAGVLFFPTIHPPSTPSARDGKITVLYQPPQNSGKASSTLDIPLEPDTTDLEQIEVTMHNSPTPAYLMPAPLNAWFSAHFAHDVLLAYLGPHYRPVLMSTPSLSPTTSWLKSLLPGATEKPQTRELTFADCAPYLIVSSTSLTSLHPRLPPGQQMDIAKFRPNITISGAAEPWEEDFWAELLVHSSSPTHSASDEPVRIACVHNCGRCKSINIDYALGEPGKGEEGRMLAKMQRDRRVDGGVKWSPVFGRYAFLREGGEGRVVRVGDEVVVGGRNGGHTRFDWEGLSTA